MTTSVGSDLVVRSSVRLRLDDTRTVARLFVAGQEEVGGGESRAGDVIGRVLALGEDEVERALADVMERFDHRHHDFSAMLERHAATVAHRVARRKTLSPARRLLLGATFTHEYAIEAAALCNPSIVRDPDQRTAPAGSVRFIMSVRCIGEGHRSSIGFRTGLVDAHGSVSIDAPGPYPVMGDIDRAPIYRSVIHGKLAQIGDDGESAAFLLDQLGETFTAADLNQALAVLHSELATRYTAVETIARVRAIASSCYSATFPRSTAVSERVLWPTSPAESNGMEDARFVHFTDDDGTSSYYATYTAFDGRRVDQHLLSTNDFVRFDASPVVGAGAANKGLALFPRRIGGRFVALSRSDRETNAITSSDDMRHWDTAVTCQVPERSWELIQLGNCGSPIETAAGWLVLTHGVGAMRTYSIGAILLDLDDPTRVVGHLAEPLLVPARDEQDGYVPNVVYTCGAMVHEDTLVIPYGIADSSIGFATAPLGALVERISRS
jgi:predicted GH43/DUF377 family glycosyl hydrolase